MLAQQHDFTVWQAAADQAGSFQTAEPRHADVHNDDVRLQLASFFHRILPVDGLSTNLVIRLVLKQGSHTPSQDLVVVDYQETHRRTS